MTTAATYLLLVAFVLFAALVSVIALWRHDSRQADRLAESLSTERGKNRHLQTLVTGYRSDLSRLSAQNAQLRERNAELRDDLHGLTAGDPSLIEAVTADLADIEITHPGDPR